MNRFYTDETKPTTITSLNRISGRDSNCIIPMGYHLNNQYSRYDGEVRDFYGISSMNFDGQRLRSNLDCFEFLETSYNSHSHYNGPNLVSGIIFHGSRLYRRTEYKAPFIADSRLLVEMDYNGDYNGLRNWVLLLAVTPIKDPLKQLKIKSLSGIPSKKDLYWVSDFCEEGRERKKNSRKQYILRKES